MITAMVDIISRLGGVTAVARMLNIRAPSVSGWAGRVPQDRCPAIERASAGSVTCEELRPDVRWQRVADADWPHPAGRPCIDVAAPELLPTPAHPAPPAAEQGERDAA